MLTVGGMQAATVDQMRADSSFDYSKFTYQWTDSAGTSHTSALTEKATNPRQIMALLAEVFTNPKIPGQNYGYNYGGTKSGYRNYNDLAKTASWMKTYHPDSVENPVEGKTVLLVEVYSDWNVSKSSGDPLTYITRCYKSVQLLDRNKYIPDSINPGYLFSINGLSTNKFFFISKGKARKLGGGPLRLTYEQISPVVAGNDTTTQDFSALIRSGKIYYMDHDCGDCPTTRDANSDRTHEFTVSASGESYSFQNLTLFITDRRFENEQEPNPKYTNDPYCVYRSVPDSIKPKNLMYLCTLGDPTTAAIKGQYAYNVDLGWTTSLDGGKLGVVVPQTYYIYATIDGKRTLVGTTTDIQHFTYKAAQRQQAYDIIFQITSSPVESNIEAQSVTKKVTIPGYGQPLFLKAQSYRSRYDMGTELNIYKNSFSLAAGSETDYNNLGAGNYDVVRTDLAGNAAVIAHVALSGNAGAFKVAVNYEAATQDIKHLFDKETPATAATLAAWTDSVILIDRFTASTAQNAQQGGYSYQLLLSKDTVSNALNVPVYRTSSAVQALGVTKAQVEADTQHTLTGAGAVQVTFNAIADASANIQDYTIYRDNLADASRTGKAELASAATYNVNGRDASGSLSATQPSVTVTGDSAAITVPDYAAATTATLGYVPVLTTNYNGDASQPNTYGCDIKNVSLPQVKLTVEDGSVNRTREWWASAGVYHAAYGVTLDITPTVTTSIPNVYYYRLWRVDEDGTETLLNSLDENIGSGWATTYGNIKGYYPDAKKEVSVRDIYIGNQTKGVDKQVTYIVRMYSTTVAQSSSAASKVQALPDLGYYVTEDRVKVVYTAETIISGVTDVLGTKQAVSVRYYNVAGQVSATPFEGVNIVRTTYTDGTTSTHKVIKH